MISDKNSTNKNQICCNKCVSSDNCSQLCNENKLTCCDSSDKNCCVPSDNCCDSSNKKCCVPSDNCCDSSEKKSCESKNKVIDSCLMSNNCCSFNDQEIKQKVKEGYSAISKQSKKQNETSLCGIDGQACCGNPIFNDNYSEVEGYLESADLGLGCGIPTSAIKIKEGDIVLDLGSGAGNDCFVARKMVGSSGKVIGLDMTPDMLKKAWENNDKLGYNNIEFRFGEIEEMPILSSFIDVVISNCVINLVPNKNKAFEEISRVLKQNGIFSISDVVVTGELPDKIRKASSMYVGCAAGALKKEDYIKIITSKGFNCSIVKEKEINIPDSVFKQYLNDEELESYKKSEVKILSITVVGQKK